MGIFDFLKKKEDVKPVTAEKPVYDKASLEEFKAQLNKAKEEQGDWKTPYTELMKAVYEQPVLFFALSREQYDKENNTSIPLISTKDFGGVPALYVFSDVNVATGWMQHYGFVTDDMKYGLIGAIRKEQFNFLSVFNIAAHLGAQMIMLDEGGAFVGIRISEFFEANGIDPTKVEVPISKEEAEKMMANNIAPQIGLPKVPAIPLTRS